MGKEIRGIRRRHPVGAELLEQGGVHFRLWAPRWRRAYLVRSPARSAAKQRSSRLEMQAEPGGYFSLLVPEAKAGDLYFFAPERAGAFYPDPASRFQPDGPHGPSEVINPRRFKWSDRAWGGPEVDGEVIYEMHLGTFTAAGTWKAAMAQLPELARLGLTMLEIMPIAEFPGRFGWGYDGVDLFAPSHLYGRPDDFRRFVDRAHQLGLSVILDVVYNHLGPDGNFLKIFSEDYFTDRYANDWGEAINFDGDNSGPVREFFTANAAYWMEEFHIDGLRLDATQQIYDRSADSILSAITRTVRAAGGGKRTFIVAENEPQEVRLLRPLEQGGHGIDAMWNDDFHHSAMVRLAGRSEAYYCDYLGTPQEFISAAKYGFIYQGQRYRWQKQRRGTPTFGLKPRQFVCFIQNHDQIANSFRGDRVHQLSSPGRFRAMSGLLLLGPWTPMLYQGQEFAATAPFLYFADHNPELAVLVAKGRREFLAQFPSLAQPGTSHNFAEPSNPETFRRCKLDFAERTAHAPTYLFHRDLLALRRAEIIPRLQAGAFDGAVLGPEAFLLRYFGGTNDHLLVLINFGSDLALDPAPEPLLAPPEGTLWKSIWTSEDPIYGGSGNPELDTKQNWRIPGRAAVVLVPRTPRKKK